MARRPAGQLVPLEPKTSDPMVLAVRTHARGMKDIGEGLHAIARAIEANTAQRAPADEFFAAATARLDHLCRFLKRKGPWLLASVPPVVFAILSGAPSGSRLITELLKDLTQ